MKSAIEWFNEKGFTFDDKITIKDVINLQNDARKDGLMSAQSIASGIIMRESPKYAQPNQKLPSEMTLSGLSFFVASGIISEADKLDYLPCKSTPKDVSQQVSEQVSDWEKTVKDNPPKRVL